MNHESRGAEPELFLSVCIDYKTVAYAFKHVLCLFLVTDNWKQHYSKWLLIWN